MAFSGKLFRLKPLLCWFQVKNPHGKYFTPDRVFGWIGNKVKLKSISV